jgi:DUF4097 and DUF4098 domain-containing protein YvlB
VKSSYILSSFALVSAVIGITQASGSTQMIQSFDLRNVKSVKIVNHTGNLTLTSAPYIENKATLMFNRIDFRDDDCFSRATVEGTTLLIETKSKSNFHNQDRCRTNISLKLPKKTLNYSLSVGSGELSLSGLQGDLDFSTGSGDVKAEGAYNKVSGKTGSGKLWIRGLRGQAKLKVGSGDIKLEYQEPRPRGILDVKTGSGDINIHLPSSTRFKSHFMSGSGHFTTDLAESHDGELDVFVVSGSGNLRIQSKK